MAERRQNAVHDRKRVHPLVRWPVCVSRAAAGRQEAGNGIQVCGTPPPWMNAGVGGAARSLKKEGTGKNGGRKRAAAVCAMGTCGRRRPAVRVRRTAWGERACRRARRSKRASRARTRATEQREGAMMQTSRGRRGARRRRGRRGRGRRGRGRGRRGRRGRGRGRGGGGRRRRGRGRTRTRRTRRAARPNVPCRGKKKDWSDSSPTESGVGGASVGVGGSVAASSQETKAVRRRRPRPPGHRGRCGECCGALCACSGRCCSFRACRGPSESTAAGARRRPSRSRARGRQPQCGPSARSW